MAAPFQVSSASPGVAGCDHQPGSMAASELSVRVDCIGLAQANNETRQLRIAVEREHNAPHEL